MKSSYCGWFKIISFCIVFCFCLPASAQEPSPGKIPLKEMILLLEEAFEVRFSYRESDIDQVMIRKPPRTSGLRGNLAFIEKQTSLKFTALDERYIAITVDAAVLSFCGVIRDKTTHEPLAGATVRGVGSTATAVTDLQGKFMLENMKDSTGLQIRYLGYDELMITIRLPTSGINCQDIFLEPAYESLKETVVINYLTSGIHKRKDGSTYINTERFGILPGLVEPDILQTIEALPGVESVNETISNINIRGGTSDQNLVLFDGIKMYLTGHFFGLISAFNPSLTNEAVVIKNGSSPSYNEGVSGTIDIRSRDNLVQRFSGGAGINLVSADAFFQMPVSENLELHFSGRRSINDIVSTPTYNSYFSRTFQDTQISSDFSEENLADSDFGYYDASLKVLYDPNDDHKFRFTLIQIHNDLDYREFQSPSEETRQSNLTQDNLALGGTWTARWKEDISTQTSSYLTRYDLDAMNFTTNTGQRLLQKNEVLESGLKINTTKILGQAFQIDVGYQFYEIGVSNIENLNNPFYSSRIKNVIRSHSAFSEVRYSGNRTYIKGGLRFNYLPKFGKSLLEPRININQNLGNKFSLKAQAELKSQTTSQIIDLQGDFLGVESRRWILADNETYPVIQSRQASIGVDYKSGGWYLDMEGYYKVVEGISTSNQGFQDQHEFIRTSGSYTAKGVEVLINKKSGPFHTYLNYTFSENSYRFEELVPQTFPNNFDIRHSASVAVNYSYGNFKFSVGGNIRSGKPYTKPEEGDETRREGNNWVVNYASPNEEVLPSFFRLDFSTAYNLKLQGTGNVLFSLGILNLTDRENIINRYYRVDRNNPRHAVEINNASLGMTPNASVRISF